MLRGDSSTGFGRVDRVIYRGRSHILTGSLTLNSKDSDNFINGQFLSSSSRRLTTVDAQADFSGPQLGGAFDVSFGYTRGIGAFNALKDPPGLTSLTPHATFDKVHLNISYYRPFGLFGRKFYWSSQAGGQYAFQTLYSTEQFSVGGFDTVRGFQSASLTNDHGASLRNDLGVIQPLRFLRQDGLFKFYTGFDSGYVIGRARGSLKGTLVSATVGASLSWWRASFDVYAANPIAQPSIVRDHGLMVRGRLTLHL